MPDHNDFEVRLSDAMRRYADLAPTDVDATALAREIAEAPMTERRLHFRWRLFGRDHSATDEPHGRSSIMSIALGTAALAVVAIGAGYALVGGPYDTVDQVPAAITTDTVGDDWTFFEGELSYDGDSIDGTDPLDAEVINGLVVERETGWRDQTLTTSDPRMTGSRTEFNNRYTNFAGGASGPPGSIWANSAVIEAEGGTWSCLLEGASAGDSSVEAGWCTGESGFEGLRAFIVFDSERLSATTWGYITAAEGPPMPEASAAE